ncbi:hypothetical protein EXIGLDRAFT_746508 [Exidia glandulosa HHB12029]|uniref:Arrestin-like N-terminal domain-containing protein n=1 Tax=Exidia glandulosa HHB12029 TaxID=1314781 RepID=A0A165M130_EXIGL|nr:hypothetical protein EXIGLDRAFT_746508 [Exidia glandulosa HHB12029]
MLSPLGFGASLKLVPHQGVLFLRPDPDDADNDDVLLYGDVLVTLPQSKDIGKIVVRHVLNYTVSPPGYSSEQGQLEVDETEIEVNTRLQRGEHRFPWAIRLSQTTLPYERTAYGLVVHMLEACAPGAGAFASDLQASFRLKVVMSPVRDYYVQPVERRLDGALTELGPYSVVLRSPHLTVAGLLHISISLPSVPSDISLASISISVAQSTVIQLPSQPEKSINTPDQILNVVRLNRSIPRQPLSQTEAALEPGVLYTAAGMPHDSTLLAVIPTGQAFDAQYLTRLPNDQELRPTTIHGVRTKRQYIFSISHELRIEIVYSTPTSRQRLAKFRQPISFLSCCVSCDGALLPCYSQTDSDTSASSRAVDVERTLRECVCERSMAQVMGQFPNFYAEALTVPTPVEGQAERRPKAIYVPGENDSSSSHASIE